MLEMQNLLPPSFTLPAFSPALRDRTRIFRGVIGVDERLKLWLSSGISNSSRCRWGCAECDNPEVQCVTIARKRDRRWSARSTRLVGQALVSSELRADDDLESYDGDKEYSNVDSDDVNLVIW